MSGPLYEKTAVVTPQLADEFGDWLREHVADAKSHAGVIAVDTVATLGRGRYRRNAGRGRR
ncbi:MAG: hypothetical protein AAGE85_07280 [Pseudomonadota bacterium]